MLGFSLLELTCINGFWFCTIKYNEFVSLYDNARLDAISAERGMRCAGIADKVAIRVCLIS